MECAFLRCTDVFRGGIYRVEIATERTQRIYQHDFGVNMARRDSLGGLWFTQSARNRPEHGKDELWQAVEHRTPEGAVYYVAPPLETGNPSAVRLVSGLRFANGIALDEPRGHLYVAETMDNRVHRFEMDVRNGSVRNRAIAAEVDHPDNMEFDGRGRLWIACPIRSELVVLDPRNGRTESVFRISTPRSAQTIEEIKARVESGRSWLDLVEPALWEPGPGLITGLILSPDDGPTYATGLGNAIIRLPR